ncbi:MAG: hypothetical protein C5B56_15230 [Proteobacteria bacterium]|nr:MAG: hypothetical protein C5B56_15230 [Pseudomonadota bacterium]
MRPQGTPAKLERRRLRAIDLLQRDIPVHVVAERLGVDRRSVRRWKRAHRQQGRAGPRAHPASGRPPGGRRSSMRGSVGASCAWSSRALKRPAIAPACGRVDTSSI